MKLFGSETDSRIKLIQEDRIIFSPKLSAGKFNLCLHDEIKYFKRDLRSKKLSFLEGDDRYVSLHPQL